MTVTALTGRTFEAFVRRSPNVLVDFVNGQNQDGRSQQQQLATALRAVRDVGSQVPFATVDVLEFEELRQRFVQDQELPQLLWFRNGEPTSYHRTLRTAKEIQDFVLALDRDPLVPVTSRSHASSLYNRVILAQVPKDSQMYRALEVVALQKMDTVAVCHLPSTGVTVTWLEGDSQEEYMGPSDVAPLARWVRGLAVKSEPIPTESEDEGSKVLVARTFEDTVFNGQQDVVLLVYASWCGWSRRQLLGCGCSASPDGR